MKRQSEQIEGNVFVKLSAARVRVRSHSEAQAFYGTTLSLPLLDGGAVQGYCVFGADRTQLIVEPVAEDASAEDQALVGRFTGLSFAVPSVSEAYSARAAAGVTFTGAPERQPWGGGLATFKDPAGNRLQLVQAPSAA